MKKKTFVYKLLLSNYKTVEYCISIQMVSIYVL